MNATTTSTLLSFAEFQRLYENEPCVELVEGLVVRNPMPTREHGRVCNMVAYYLTAHVLPLQLGQVFSNDTDLRIRHDPDTVLRPDVQFISYARLPRTANHWELTDAAPELAVEVRSPSNAWAELERKAELYLGVGVLAVLVLEIDDRTATVFRRSELNQVFDNGDTFTLPDVLPGFAVPVSAFFA